MVKEILLDFLMTHIVLFLKRGKQVQAMTSGSIMNGFSRRSMKRSRDEKEVFSWCSIIG